MPAEGHAFGSFTVDIDDLISQIRGDVGGGGF
jgi:hypothetical protein